MPLYKTTIFLAGSGGPWGAGLGWSEQYWVKADTLEAGWAQYINLKQARTALLPVEYQILAIRMSGGVRPAVSEEYEEAYGGAWNGSFDYSVGHQALAPNFGLLLRVQLTTGGRAMRFLRGVTSDVVNPVTFQLLVNNPFKTALNAFSAWVVANTQIPGRGGPAVGIQNVIPWRGGTRKVGRPFGTPRKRTRIR